MKIVRFQILRSVSDPQCFALIGMNVLNLLILRLVQGAVMRSSKARDCDGQIAMSHNWLDQSFRCQLRFNSEDSSQGVRENGSIAHLKGTARRPLCSPCPDESKDDLQVGDGPPLSNYVEAVAKFVLAPVSQS